MNSETPGSDRPGSGTDHSRTGRSAKERRGGFDSALLDRLAARVVGRRRELEAVVAALAARRNLL
ncbi:MAG: hypothetical protein KDB13_15655, partial [Microthrixaceae bacterium]|nr:hypothetical protein [Microthrixaceae bacterium]